MKIREIPWFDRPWTRLKNKGVSNLSNAELLAVVLGRVNGVRTTISICFCFFSSDKRRDNV